MCLIVIIREKTSCSNLDELYVMARMNGKVVLGSILKNESEEKNNKFVRTYIFYKLKQLFGNYEYIYEQPYNTIQIDCT